MNDTIVKFGYPWTLLAEYDRWVVLLRQKQVTAGSMVRLSTRRGSVEVAVEPNPRMRPGHISLPNGMGLTSGEAVPHADAAREVPPRVGIAPNELTSSDDRDGLSGIPMHKHVRARIDVL